jgi:drug/metabolite transporter (DMT)-like permease
MNHQQQQQVELMQPKQVLVVERPPSTASLLWWLAAAVLSAVLALLTLAAALTMTVGVAQACQQYRENLIESLAADGYLASLLTERLSCQAVFDFMDFLQPIKERHSANFINSGVALHFAIFALWIGAVAWVAAALASVFEALRARSCCSCCAATSN